MVAVVPADHRFGPIAANEVSLSTAGPVTTRVAPSTDGPPVWDTTISLPSIEAIAQSTDTGWTPARRSVPTIVAMIVAVTTTIPSKSTVAMTDTVALRSLTNTSGESIHRARCHPLGQKPT